MLIRPIKACANECVPEVAMKHQGSSERKCGKSALEERTLEMTSFMKVTHWTIVLFATALVSTTLVQRGAAQDQQEQDDPPSRVARLGYMQGSISFQPAGESEWVEAAQNRPLTTGDQLWSDRDSRAELSLGSAVIDLNSNTGISFLNLDDRTAQIQLSSGLV